MIGFRHSTLILVALLALSAIGFAQDEAAAPAATVVEQTVAEPTVESVAPEAPAPAEKPASIVLTPPPQKPAAKVVVFMPEKIDTAWFWYYYTEEQQSIVQSAIEKELIRSGYDVIDLTLTDVFSGEGTIEEITSPAMALKKAVKLGATYAIVGHASAVQASAGSAYNVTVIRSSAEGSAKIIRVSDGKVLDIVDASAQGSAQAQKAAAQGALKDLSAKFAPRLVSALTRADQAQ